MAEGPHPDVPALFRRLRAQGRDDAHVEVKASTGDVGRSIWETVSAFANTTGGLIVLGASEQDGFRPVVDFAIDRVVDQFVDGMGDGNPAGARMTRPPTYRVRREVWEGAPILLIEVGENPPDAKPCYVTARGIQGGSFKRVDDKDVQLSSTEIYELQHVMTPSTADREAVPEAMLDDLDPERLASLMRARSGEKALSGVADERGRLRRLNVLDNEGGVRLAALLTLGAYPQQFLPRLVVDVVAHPGVERGAPAGEPRFVDRHECDGPLAEVVEAAVAAVRRNLRVESVISGVGRIDRLEVPQEVLREAVANAVLHREYGARFVGQPVSVDIFPDRVEVLSPGGLWGGKTAANLDDGVSRCRNATLLQMLRRTPLGSGAGTVAEGEGGGVAMMKRAMAEAGLPEPRFAAGPDEVRVVLTRRGTATVDAAVTMTSASELTIGLTPGDLALLSHLSEVEPRSIHELATLSGRAANALRPALRRLIDAGRLTPTAPARSRDRRYLLTPLAPRRSTP